MPIHSNARVTRIANQLHAVAREIERQDRVGHVPAPILDELEQLARQARRLVQAQTPRVDPDGHDPRGDGDRPVAVNPYV